MKKGIHILGGFILLITLFSFMLIDKTHSGWRTAATTDSVFLQEAASSGMMEVEMGKIAEQNATNPRVKAFGAMMVRDHTTSNAELKAIAGKMGVTLPTGLLPKQTRQITLLEGLSGTVFDRSYINMMVQAHKEDMDEFEEASKKATDLAVRSFASRLYPILVMHRDSAIAIRKR